MSISEEIAEMIINKFDKHINNKVDISIRLTHNFSRCSYVNLYLYELILERITNELLE